MDPYQRLKDLGLALPALAAPVGSYVPAVLHDRTLYVAGQTPAWEGQLRHRGRVGLDLSIAEGYEAARLCILNALAAAESVIGDLRRVEQVLRVTGYVVAPQDCPAGRAGGGDRPAPCGEMTMKQAPGMTQELVPLGGGGPQADSLRTLIVERKQRPGDASVGQRPQIGAGGPRGIQHHHCA